MAKPSAPSGFRDIYERLLEDSSEWASRVEEWSALPWLEEFGTAVAPLARLATAGVDHADWRLFDLYAASRVRDLLLFAHQPAGEDDADLPLVPIETVVAFFAPIRARPAEVAAFTPAVHEIVAVEPADDPAAPFEILEQLWPALMLGELVFARGGVRVRAGADHVRADTAERSTLYWEHRRRHRPTAEISRRWSASSQWRTEFRRDYVTDGRTVFNLGGYVDPRRPHAEQFPDDEVEDDPPRPEQRVELLTHRCLVRSPLPADGEFFPYNWTLELD